MEAWILAKPASTSEISSQAGEGDFDDERLVDTPKQHEVQVLVVQSQNGANMVTSSTLTAPSRTFPASSTPLPAVLRLPSSILRVLSRILRLPSSTLHLIIITIYLLCQLGLLNQLDILVRQAGHFPLMLTQEQLLHQQQLLREKQEFDAWRASRAQAKTQSQPQAFAEAEANIEVNVDSSEGSASVARARPQYIIYVVKCVYI